MVAISKYEHRLACLCYCVAIDHIEFLPLAHKAANTQQQLQIIHPNMWICVLFICLSLFYFLVSFVCLQLVCARSFVCLAFFSFISIVLLLYTHNSTNTSMEATKNLIVIVFHTKAPNSLWDRLIERKICKFIWMSESVCVWHFLCVITSTIRPFLPSLSMCLSLYFAAQLSLSFNFHHYNTYK